MKKFAVIVHGQNFLIQDKDDKFPGLREFYIHAYPEADTAEEAEGKALELVRELLKARTDLSIQTRIESVRLFSR